MRRIVFSFLILASFAVVAEPVADLSANTTARARDSDVAGGLAGDFSALNTIPASDTALAAIGLSSSEAAIEILGGTSVDITLDVTHSYDNTGGSIADVDSALTNSTLSFTVLENASYVISGIYAANGANGYAMAIDVRLRDLTNQSFVFTDQSASNNLSGASTLAPGVPGDGNDVDSLAGALTGPLVAGREYSLQVLYIVSNNTDSVSAGTVSPNQSEVTATGQFHLLIEPAAGTDSDGDGVADATDNCTLRANATQLDTNGDGIGNACDADINGDCLVNFGDLALLKAGFFPTNNADADFNGDTLVNFGDLAFMKSTFFNSAAPGPGPSGLPNSCNTP